MRARWVVVLAAAAALIVVPLAVGVRPSRESDVTAVELARRIQASGTVGWSGLVQTTGTVSVPDSDAFANLGKLLGERSELRVWWRDAEEWRVDTLRSTGETGLYADHGVEIRWEFESQRATVTPTSRVRLPEVSDLLPPTLARGLLAGAQPAELTRLPARRVAGVSTAGVRLTPEQPASTLDRIDVWADVDSGLPLLVEAYADGNPRPALTTGLQQVTVAAPPPETTRFTPARNVELVWEQSVEAAAEANALASADLPARLGGLDSALSADPGPVGLYGAGPASMLVLPLRGQVAWPLRQRLRESPAVQDSQLGTALAVGPVSVLLTRRGEGGSFLLTGTVTAEVLQRAAAELAARR